MQRQKIAAKTKNVTAQQVADLAGVSTSAVSRAFTPGASSSSQTRAKVKKAADALGYQPNVLARSLMTGRTELVGLVSNNFDNPAFMEIFDLFTRKLQDNGLRPLLVNLSGDSEPAKAAAMLRQYNVDAVIIASSTVSQSFVTACLDTQIPLVHAFGKTSAPSGVHIVGADNVQGGRCAAQMLLKYGYQRVAFLGGPVSASSTLERYQGFETELQSNGQKPIVGVFAESYSHDEGLKMMRALLKKHHLDAVFCGDDILAMGAMDACKELKVSIPGDMGILGFNNIAMASWAAYDLSTIHQPIAQIIVAAVERAIQLLENPGLTPMLRRFPCEALLRGTLQSR